MALPDQGTTIVHRLRPARLTAFLSGNRGTGISLFYLASGSFLSIHYLLEPNARLDILVPAVSLIAFILPLGDSRFQKAILTMGMVALTFMIWPLMVALSILTLLVILSWALAFTRISYPIKVAVWLGALGLLFFGRHELWIEGYEAMILGGMVMLGAPMALKRNRIAKERNGSLWEGFLSLLPLPAIALPIFPSIQGGSARPPRVTERLIKVGSRRMLEGILLLLAYRILYSICLLPASEVNGPWSLGAHWLTNAALIVRLAGFIRLATGLLNLLGYALALPSIGKAVRRGGLHGLLAACCSPWVRWLDRMIYRPLIMVIPSTWHAAELVSRAVAWVGVAASALALHACFWFLRFGHLQLRWVDLIFWCGLVALLLIENTWNERVSAARSKVRALSVLLASLALLAAMPLFSLVSTHSLAGWLTILRSGIGKPIDALVIPSLLLPIFLMLWSLGRLTERKTARLAKWTLMGGVLFFLAWGLQPVHRSLWELEPRSIYVSKAGPSRSDDLAMAGGYYAEIIDPRSDNRPDPSESLEIKEKFAYTQGAEKVPDFRRITQKRSFSFTFKGHPYTTNSMGFRDMEYRMTPAPNTVRTLLLGSSFVAGSGVRDEEVFDVLLEASMNRSKTETQFEFLNASCSIYDLIDCIVRFDMDSLALLKPDYLIIFSHGLDTPKNVRDVVEAKLGGYAMPYPYIDSILTKAGMHDGMSESEAIQALRPYGTQLVRESYMLLAEKCRFHGIEPIWVYWPCMIMLEGYEQDYKTSLGIVSKLGFEVIDLETVYKDFDPSDLIVAANDHHPNALGHILVARALQDHFTHRFPLLERR